MCHLILPLMWWKMPVDLSFSTGLNATFSLYSLSVNCLLNGSLFHSFDVLYPTSYSYYSPVACFLSHANNVHFSLRQLFLSVEFWVDVDFFFISLINMFRPFFLPNISVLQWCGKRQIVLPAVCFVWVWVSFKTCSWLNGSFCVKGEKWGPDLNKLNTTVWRILPTFRFLTISCTSDIPERECVISGFWKNGLTSQTSVLPVGLQVYQNHRYSLKLIFVSFEMKCLLFLYYLQYLITFYISGTRWCW